jgi:hypothetical protein
VHAVTSTATIDADGRVVVGVLNHHVYGGARPGSLHNVYLKLQYEDGSRSNGFVPAEALRGDLQVLHQYTKKKTGMKILKYVAGGGKGEDDE